MTKDGRWKTARSKGKYLFTVKAMSKVFRAKYVAALKSRLPEVDKQLVNSLFKKEWVVYAKRPFAHPKYVIEYLGRYTHKVAISNHRLGAVTDDTVMFTYKDYRKGAKQQEMTLSGMEFIRRFSTHILPKGFVRIRHYGILSSTTKPISIPVIKAQCFEAMGCASDKRELVLYDPSMCPHCKTMLTVELMPPKRGPPGSAIASIDQRKVVGQAIR